MTFPDWAPPALIDLYQNWDASRSVIFTDRERDLLNALLTDPRMASIWQRLKDEHPPRGYDHQLFHAVAWALVQADGAAAVEAPGAYRKRLRRLAAQAEKLAAGVADWEGDYGIRALLPAAVADKLPFEVTAKLRVSAMLKHMTQCLREDAHRNIDLVLPHPRQGNPRRLYLLRALMTFFSQQYGDPMRPAAAVIVAIALGEEVNNEVTKSATRRWRTTKGTIQKK